MNLFTHISNMTETGKMKNTLKRARENQHGYGVIYGKEAESIFDHAKGRFSEVLEKSKEIRDSVKSYEQDFSRIKDKHLDALGSSPFKKLKIRYLVNRIRKDIAMEVFLKKADAAISSISEKYEIDIKVVRKACDKKMAKAAIEFAKTLESAEKIHDAINSYEESFEKFVNKANKAAESSVSESAFSDFIKSMNPAKWFSFDNKEKESKNTGTEDFGYAKA